MADSFHMGLQFFTASATIQTDGTAVGMGNAHERVMLVVARLRNQHRLPMRLDKMMRSHICHDLRARVYFRVQLLLQLSHDLRASRGSVSPSSKCGEQAALTSLSRFWSMAASSGASPSASMINDVRWRHRRLQGGEGCENTYTLLTKWQGCSQYLRGTTQNPFSF